MSKHKTARRLRLDLETLRILGTDLAHVLGGNGDAAQDPRSVSWSISEIGCPKCCACNRTGQ